MKKQNKNKQIEAQRSAQDHRPTKLLPLSTGSSECCSSARQLIGIVISIFPFFGFFNIFREFSVLSFKRKNMEEELHHPQPEQQENRSSLKFLMISIVIGYIKKFPNMLIILTKASMSKSTTQRKKQLKMRMKQEAKQLVSCSRDSKETSEQIIMTTELDITLDKVEIIEKFTTSFLLKNNPILQQTRDYEIPLPYLIMNWEQVFVEELSSAMCALANEEQGGFILIAAKHDGMTIQQGISNFFKEDKEKIQDLVKRAMKPIVPQRNIQVKVEGLSLYPDVWTAFKDEKSEEFVIKISVAPKAGSKWMCLNEKNKSTYEIVRIGKSGSLDACHVIKTTENGIYDLMCYVANHELRPKTNIRKSIKMDSKLMFDLETFTMKIGLIPTHKNQWLSYFLNVFKILGQSAFPKIGSSQIVLQLQIIDNSKPSEVLKNVQEHLKTFNVPLKFIEPFCKFQNDIPIKYNQDKSVSYYYVCYLILTPKEFNQNFRVEIKKTMRDKFKQQLVIDEVKHKFTIGTLTENKELQLLKVFLQKNFTCMPETKVQKYNETLFYQVQFTFKDDDLNAAAFSYFCFSLAKKRLS